MSAPDLILEHREGNKKKRSLRIQAKHEMFLIGSSKDADLRLTGEKIAGCHMVLKYRAPHWYACDLSGSEETLLDEKNIVEQKLKDAHVLKIGNHQIRLLNKSTKKVLFTNDVIIGEGAKQQIVIRRGWGVVETFYRDRNAIQSFRNGEKVFTLAAPTSHEWVVTEIGKRIIQQRLVPLQATEAAEAFKFDKDFLKPLAIVLMIFAVLGVGVALTPKTNTAKNLDEKSLDIIFNAKVIQKKRTESKKVQMAAKAKKGGSDAPNVTAKSQAMPEESQAPKVSNKTTAALTNLRASGLNSLIGKIAKRAAKSGIMIAANGATADKAPGRAFYGSGTATVGGGGSASKAGTTYKLGGVGTKGVGGGASNVGEGTALVGGAVGQGEVAMVDDETVIEGGLDKDVIAEVIRRNIGQIRYCYERQLSANRDLYGKVLVHFVINAGGLVNDPKIENSTLKSPMVEGCVLRRLAGWKFPLPKGGTSVRVSYPFLFKALD
jgi:TonB family protein